MHAKNCWCTYMYTRSRYACIATACLLFNLPMIPTKRFLKMKAPIHIHSNMYKPVRTLLETIAISLYKLNHASNVNNWNRVTIVFGSVLYNIIYSQCKLTCLAIMQKIITYFACVNNLPSCALSDEYLKLVE